MLGDKRAGPYPLLLLSPINQVLGVLERGLPGIHGGGAQFPVAEGHLGVDCDPQPGGCVPSEDLGSGISLLFQPQISTHFFCIGALLHLRTIPERRFLLRGEPVG